MTNPVTPEERKAALEVQMRVFDKMPLPMRELLREEPMGVAMLDAYNAYLNCQKAGLSDQEAAGLIGAEIMRQSDARAPVPRPR